jgi:hypothetical protein
LPVGTPFKVKLSPGATVAEIPVPTTDTVTVGLGELPAWSDRNDRNDWAPEDSTVPTMVAPPAEPEEEGEIVEDELQPIANAVCTRAKAAVASTYSRLNMALPPMAYVSKGCTDPVPSESANF